MIIWPISRKWPIYRLSITFSINSPPNQATKQRGATWRWKGTKAHKKYQRLLQKSSRNQNIYSTLFSLWWHIQTCSRVMFLAADFVLLSDTSPSSWPWSLTLGLVFFFFPLYSGTLSSIFDSSHHWVKILWELLHISSAGTGQLKQNCWKTA